MTTATAIQTSEDLFPVFPGRRIAFDPSAEQVAYFTKYSGSRVDYSVDLSHRLAAQETVVAAYAETDSADLTIPEFQRFERGVTCFLEGGVDGILYRLTLTVSTNQGRILTFYADILCHGGADELDTFFKAPLMGDPSDPAQNYITDIFGRFLCPTWVGVDGLILGDGSPTNDYGDP